MDVDVELRWAGDERSCGPLLAAGEHPSHVAAMLARANEALSTAVTSGV